MFRSLQSDGEPSDKLTLMLQSWTRTSTSTEAALYDEFQHDLGLMLDLFRFTENLVDRSGSEESSNRIVLRPAVGLDSGLFEWPKHVIDDESDRAKEWGSMRTAGRLGQLDGFYSVATNGSPFSAVVSGALIRAKHIYKDVLSVSDNGTWDEHWDRDGTAVHAARDWVQTVFGEAKIPTS